jgi:acetolactate synthase-1/2/3 large subunit
VASYADVVAATLAEAGIEYIFGVPGSLSSVELIEAASKRGIRYVLAGNESSAAVMAGVYGALTNRPGVVSTGVGPGAAAALHGAAIVHLERDPVLFLTDRFGDEEYRHVPRQRIDQGAAFAPLTKGAFTLHADDAAETMRRAIALTMSGRPGPVQIDLPYDLMQAEADPSQLAASHPHPDPLPQGRGNIEDIAAAIAEARRPAVIVGLQVNRSGVEAEEAFTQLAEALGAPVFATLSAKGTLPEQHPLAAGTFRGTNAERVLLDQADLFVMVGFDPVEQFSPNAWPYKAPVVVLDETPPVGAAFEAAVEVIAPLAPALRALSQVVRRAPGWNREDIEAYKKRRETAMQTPGETRLLPQAVIRIARQRLPDDGILTVDAGQHKVLTSDLWETRRRRGFLTSSGLGSMAVAIPAALGAKLVEPNAPVLCLTGDGGFLMRAGDLETAVRENLAIVIVVFNDKALNMIKLQQDRQGYKRLGTSFAGSDFAAVARGFGFEAATVHDEAALDAALTQAFAANRPWLIDAMIDPEGYV